MWSKWKTKPVRDHTDIRNFFDTCAQNYTEQHGNPQRLLHYRLSFIHKYARFCPEDTVLEIGCGNGLHLLALADCIGHGTGIDLSPVMIEVARKRLGSSPWVEKLNFTVDKGEQLASVADVSMDVVFCVGALEHMLDKAAVIRNVFRVLKSGRRFVCLTLNGNYIWYRFLAPLFRLDTRCLSTDRFLSRSELEHLLRESGFQDLHTDYWTFIPRAFIHPLPATLLQILDGIGRFARLGVLRGGLVVCACKP